MLMQQQRLGVIATMACEGAEIAKGRIGAMSNGSIGFRRGERSLQRILLGLAVEETGGELNASFVGGDVVYGAGMDHGDGCQEGRRVGGDVLGGGRGSIRCV